MTDRTPWERLDTPAATPATVAGAEVTSSTGSGRSSRRLQRSRSPVIEAFDRGGGAFQRHTRLVLVGSTVLLVPLVAINLWATTVGFDRFDPDDAWFPSLGSGTRSGIEDLAPVLGAAVASLAASVVGYLVATVSVTDRLDGPAAAASLALWQTVRSTLRRLPALLVAWVLGHWWQPVLAIIVVSVEPADLVALAPFLGAAAWFASSFTLFVVPCMVVERLGPVAALRRSGGLAKRSFGTSALFVLVSTAVGTLYLVGAATIAPLLEANGFVDFGGAAWIVQGVLVQLGILIVLPLIASCTAQCYLEVRIEREGLDLEIDAGAAFDSGEVASDAGVRQPVRDGAPT